MGFRRADGRSGTRNFILIVPTSMCASHEAMQVATLAEFTLFSREKFPYVDGVSAIPHSKGCGCQEGSPVELLLRVLSNYADHPNVGGVVVLELGCEKTNLSVLENYLQRMGRQLNKPLVRIGIQQVGGTQGAIQAGLRAVEEMLPQVNKTVRQPIPVSELVLGVKCGGSDAFSGISANPSLGYASDLLVRSGGTVLITEVPEFCGAEHILAQRAKDAATARAVYEMVDWYKDYAGKWGAVAQRKPQPGEHQGRSAQHHDQIAGRDRQGRHHACGRRDRLWCASARQGAISDARSGLRSGIDTWPGGRGSYRSCFHHGPRIDDRQCDCSGHQAGFKQ